MVLETDYPSLNGRYCPPFILTNRLCGWRRLITARRMPKQVIANSWMLPVANSSLCRIEKIRIAMIATFTIPPAGREAFRGVFISIRPSASKPQSPFYHPAYNYCLAENLVLPPGCKPCGSEAVTESLLMIILSLTLSGQPHYHSDRILARYSACIYR